MPRERFQPKEESRKGDRGCLAAVEDIVFERESRQGERPETEDDGTSDKNLSKVEPPGRRAAAAVGLSRPTADIALRVVARLDELEEEGKDEDVESPDRRSIAVAPTLPTSAVDPSAERDYPRHHRGRP